MNAKVSIKDIARELGLAASTVSRALNGVYGVHPATIGRVRAKALEMGYVPDLGAKQLVGKSSGLIGVFMPEFEAEATPEISEFFPPLQQALKRLGKDAILFSVPHGRYAPGQLSEWVRMRKLEGCVFLPAFWRSHPLIQDALELRVPSVNFGDAVGPACSAAASGDREGGRLAGRLLTSYGHRRIGYIDGPPQLPICRERYAGFVEALAEAGIAHAPELVRAGDFSGASGARAALELRGTNPGGLTAIACANDLMAMGAIMALAQTGAKVPEDVSVIGYDGAFFTAYTNPPLSTVRHISEQMGSLAAELLAEVLNGAPGRRVIVPPALVERASVAIASSVGG
ncbi:LacI family DNA-binding transcriptional regulator [Paenibacillus thermoaerophilus]|uniref:LacI family DNA-binding transcriptional regulator n=1 Tax=Paenibacillus thermoaerophilus TaxID=1215385 RepID=A0ABW2UZM3_9BACL|nr:LacI family DNA-binding transcriptional regulator [Paenibacillus thermoaerophilus]TMV14329.1 LacI family transcriptional regulator [Paenibacillus thermoaerophilus]